jgi:uncharacterized protein
MNSFEQWIDMSLPMIIPTRQQCLSFLTSSQMPAHIQEHSHKVAEIAVGLGRYLNRLGAGLALSLVDAGGLLHDIAKMRCLRTGGNHGVVGGQMVRQLGYPQVARIVEDHVSIEATDLQFPVTESLLVNYADKRVKHTEVVSLGERFGDLVERYGVTNERKARLTHVLSLFMRLEDKIFDGLEIRPNDILTWANGMAPTVDGLTAVPAIGAAISESSGGASRRSLSHS